MMKLVVLSCMLAMASAGALISPLAYTAPYAYPASFAYTAPLLTPSNYRGPLSLAPGQPANILAADGRPLDTLDVNLDRSAHYTAKALDGAGLHLLKKRSAALIAPYAAARFISTAPIVYSSPALSTHIAAAPITYSHAPFVHVLKKRSAPLIAPLAVNHVAVAPAPLIVRAPLAYSTHIAPARFTYAAPLLHW